MYTIALILLFLTALAFAFHQALVWFLRPPTKTEVGNALKVQSLEKIASRYGKSPYIWIPKKYGPLGVRQFRAADYFAHMRRKAIHRIINQRAMGLANVGESFHPLGVETMYPSDVIPGSTSNPYTNARYSLVSRRHPAQPLVRHFNGGACNPCLTTSAQ